MFIRNDCAHFNRMDVFVQGQPVSAEWMCLFGERMHLFGKVVPVPTEQMCLFGRVAPVTTDRFPPIPI